MALPTYNPGYRELPTYTAQKWNEGEIDTLAQKRGATGLRELRSQMGRVSGLNTGGATSRMTLRDALSGYGSGVSKVMGAANAGAVDEYGNKFGAIAGEEYKAYGSKADAAKSWNISEADRAKTNFGAEMTDWELATQNKYAQSAREYLTSSQKDLMTFKKGLEGDDEWEAKLAAQMAYEKEMMRYSQDYEKDDWEAKMQKQYDLQQKAADEAFNKQRLMAGGNSTEWKPTNWNTNEGRAYNDAMTKRAAELRKSRGY
jgi:hypothetical protein